MRYILYSIGKICNLHSLKSYLHLFYYNINGFLKNLNRVFYPHSAGLADPGEPEGRRVFADCKRVPATCLGTPWKEGANVDFPSSDL
jgi:hypothetical protein